MEKVVLRIEPLHSGFLVFKGGGSAELAYACRTRDDVHALVEETYCEDVGADRPRMLPPHTEALIQRTQDDDTVPGLNAGSVP